MSDLTPDAVVRIDLHQVKEKDDTQPRRFALRDILNSSVAAAVVTTVIGGIFGQIIVAQYQARQKGKESDLAAEKARAVSRKEIVGLAADIVAEGAYHARSQHVVALRMLEPVAAGSEAAALAEQQKIIAARNDFVARWSRDKVKLGLLLRYNFGTEHGVRPAWDHCATSLDGLLKTASDEYNRIRGNPAIARANPRPNVLDPPARNLDEALERFLAAVEAVSR